MKSGDEKLVKTGNELDKFKKLKKHNCKFKRNIKRKNITHEKNNDKGYSNEKYEDDGDQFGGKQSNNMFNKN